MRQSTSERKRRTVGYTCSYIPQEIIMAAGFVPIRIVPEGASPEVDAYIYPNTCSYLKGLLAAGLGSGLSEMEGVVFANCCDGMRKLYDIWERYIPGIPALFLDIPKKRDPESVAFFASELKRLIQRIPARLDVPHDVTDEGLKRAIALSNKVREKMETRFSVMGQDTEYSWGSEAYALCLRSAAVSPQEFLDHVESAPSRAVQGAGPQHGKGVVLSGSLFSGTDLISFIEQKGGRVAALDSCVGMRHFQGRVEEDSMDPVLALATRYVSKPPCPRMYAFEERFENILQLVRSCGAGGVVYAPMKFCDSFLYDTLLLDQQLRNLGIPLLIIENQCEATIAEQTRTRIEAFLEMIG